MYTRVRAKVVNLCQRLRGRFRTNLPIGMTELESFIKSIIDIYKIPNYPSMQQAIATMIMHIPPTVCRQSKHWFAVSIFKAMANEVAYNKIQMLKEAEKLSRPDLKAVPAEKVSDK